MPSASSLVINESMVWWLKVHDWKPKSTTSQHAALYELHILLPKLKTVTCVKSKSGKPTSILQLKWTDLKTEYEWYLEKTQIFFFGINKHTIKTHSMLNCSIESCDSSCPMYSISNFNPIISISIFILNISTLPQNKSNGTANSASKQKYINREQGTIEILQPHRIKYQNVKNSK